MPSNKKPEVTPVLFRFWKKEKDVIALFPTELGTSEWWTCSSYMRLGQHGSADLRGVIHETRKAKPKEYADLKRELEKCGYVLKVMLKASSKMDQIRKDKLNEAFRP